MLATPTHTPRWTAYNSCCVVVVGFYLAVVLEVKGRVTIPSPGSKGDIASIGINTADRWAPA